MSPNPYAPPQAELHPPQGDPRDVRGWALVVIPAVAGFAMPMLMRAGLEGAATVVSMVVVIGTALIASDDARQWRMRSGNVFLSFFCLWIPMMTGLWLLRS